MAGQSTATRWAAYIARRLAGALVAVLGVAVLVFVVTHVLGDPAKLVLGPRATDAQLDQFRADNGYDRSIVAQLFSYLGQLAQGDLGISRFTREPVLDAIWTRLPATLELTLAGMGLGLLWTVPLGIWSALRPRGFVDRVSQGLVELGIALPSFWLGLLLIYLFTSIIPTGLQPVGQLDIGAVPPPRVTGMVTIDALLNGQLDTFGSALEHLSLPALTLAITSCPPILQITRNAMIASLGGDFVRHARASGLPERTVRWQAFKNALPPVTTMTAMTFGFLMGGTVLVETVFSWPGIGLYAIQSMQRFDYEPVLGVVLVASAIYVLVYLLADLLTMAIDPRVRESA